MADFGTALSVAQTLFAALGCELLKEAFSVSKYESELERLKTTVATVQSVLVDAGKKVKLSETDLNYIHKLKDAVYDADDLFDKFLTISALKQNANFFDKVRYFFSSQNPVKVAHKIFKDVKKIRSDLDAIADDRKFGLNVDTQPLRARREDTCSYLNADAVVGRDYDATRIIHRLLNSVEDVGFLTIVGIGGLGKTTLAQLVFSDNRIVSEFPIRLWVCVADQEGIPFNVDVILSKMLESAGYKLDKDSNSQLVSSEYRSKLGGKKFLLVLDDIWTEKKSEWDKLRDFLIIGGKGSRIIVTTRSKVIARTVGNDANTYDLEGLMKNDSWRLFEMSAFGEGLEHSEFNDIGRKIVEKCCNLPLAIKVVGSFLYGQSIRTWQLFERNGFVGDSDAAKDVMSILSFSYNQLDPSLKNCFAYCAIFPKDYIIDKETLLNLWNAQGYIVPFDHGQSIEHAGEEHFSVLLRRCFFQGVEKNDYGNIKSVKIHDLMHDLAQRVSKNEIFIIHSSLSSLKSSARHVSETGGGVHETNYKSKSKIRSYLRDDAREITSITMAKIVKNWVCLRSLSLIDLRSISLPEIMGNLIHLRYLKIQNSSITKLPSSIVKLHNLRTLDLNGCRILKELPKKFSKLVNLTHLYISETGLKYMPAGMSKLSGLRVLTKFVVKDESLSGKQLIGQLSDLKALVVNLNGCIDICFRRQFTSVERDWEESVIEGAEHLKFVRITFLDEYYEERVAEETIIKRLQPHPNLKKFELYYYMGKTINGWGSAHDNWAIILPNLVEINLVFCKLQQLPLLSELLHLKHLKLKYLRTLEYMEEVSSRSSESKFTFFPSLETLKIKNCKNLKGWSRGEDRSNCHLAFPRLSRLTIKSCSELTSFLACPSLHCLRLRGNNKALRITTIDEGQSSSSSALSCYNEKSSTNPDSGNTNVGLFLVDRIAHLKLVASPFVTDLKIWVDTQVESLSEFQETFQRCSSLNSLDIWGCSKLTSLCGGLEHLTALHSLSLRWCDVLKLEEGELDDGNGMPWRALHSNLRSLSLVGLPKVEKLPMGMQYLTSLQHLKIQSCDNLKEIPEWVGCLQSLQSLEIGYCNAITSLPDAMLKLTSLQELNIWQCQGLKEGCREPNGQDWPKIKYIPQIKIID